MATLFSNEWPAFGVFQFMGATVNSVSNVNVWKQIPLEHATYPLTDWRLPVCSVILYFIFVMVFSPSKIQAQVNRMANRGTKKVGLSLFDTAVVIHNAGLCVFSALVFINTAMPLLGVYRDLGATAALCRGYLDGYWHWLFYLSKYYEFIDTLILIAKGVRPPILQTFHHMGAVIGMWLVIVTESPAVCLFTCFNSGIHTLMYFYYMLTVLGYRSPLKPLMTMLQLTQFVIGSWMGSFYFVMGFISQQYNCHLNDVQLLALSFNLLYVFVLILLFVNFSVHSYILSPSRSSATFPANKKKF